MQFKGIAMESLVKTNSAKPGSIVTYGDFTFKPVKTEQKFIKSWQLDYVMYDVYRGDIDLPYISEFNNRDIEIKNILGSAASKKDISEFSACLYSSVLENDYSKNIEDILNEIKELISSQP